MIKQIKKIKKIAVFRDFSWDSNNAPEFNKYNAFYGWNGSGKTTITRILSAFQECDLSKLKLTADSNCIIKTDNGEIELSQNNITHLFKNKIRVFNEDFVNENLNWEKGKASPILIIGKEQHEQKEKLDQIIKDLGHKRTELQRKNKIRAGKEKNKNKVLENAREEIKNN